MKHPIYQYYVKTEHHGPQWLEVLRDEWDYLLVQRVDDNNQPIVGCIPYKLFRTEVRLLSIKEKSIILK